MGSIKTSGKIGIISRKFIRDRKLRVWLLLLIWGLRGQFHRKIIHPCGSAQSSPEQSCGLVHISFKGQYSSAPNVGHFLILTH